MALHGNVAISQGLRSVNFLAFSSGDNHTRKTGFDRKWRVQFSRHRQTGWLPPGHHNFRCLLGVRCHQSRAVPCFVICPEVWSKHINLYLYRTPLLWKHTHTHPIKPIPTWSQTDRWIVTEGLKKGRGKEMKVPLTLWVFLKEALDRWGGNWLLMGRNEHALLLDVTERDCS